jgi:hypothetical protein
MYDEVVAAPKKQKRFLLTQALKGSRIKPMIQADKMMKDAGPQP